jgi:hypothetical protein
VPYNDTAHVNLRRMYVPPAAPLANGPDAELRTNMMFAMIQVRGEVFAAAPCLLGSGCHSAAVCMPTH